MPTVVTSPEPIELDIAAFMKRYKTPRRQKRMRPMYVDMIAAMREIAVPQLMYQQFSLDVFGDEEPVAFRARNRDNLQSTYFGLCTLGIATDEKMAQLSQDDMALAAIFDEIGFQLVVGMARQIHKLVKVESAENELKAGPAFRPGVGRMPLELQTTVFEQLDTKQIGVTLSEDLYMVPFKSTSLVIPIYSREAAIEAEPDLDE